MPGVGSVSDAKEVDKFLRDTGRALVKAAQILKRAEPTSAAGYRLMRTGLYLHIQDQPPADAGGKTMIPPMQKQQRQQLDTAKANGAHAGVLEMAEGNLSSQRFNLDLQRLSWWALDGMGAAAEPAKNALVAEVRALLSRMPDLKDMTASDGTPLADAETQAWLDEHVLVGAGGGGGGGGADDAADAEAMKPVKAAMKDKPAEAMKLARAAIAAAASPRSRAVRQLVLAEICLGAGQSLLARGMFAGLERELRDRGLLQWETDLAGRCLEGFVRAIRAAAKAGHKYDGADEVFERLCMVDPGAAARVAG